jgi:hypothetical protein
LGQRLLQLSIVLLLQQELLPGLTSQPTLFDPEYDEFDQQVRQEGRFVQLRALSMGAMWMSKHLCGKDIKTLDSS